MKKLLTNKWVLIGAGVIALLIIFGGGNKAEAATLELGKYENRIDGGLYTGEGNYAILSGELGIFGANIEYVDTDDSQIYTTLSTGLSTPIGDFGVYGLLSSTDEDTFEVGATYGLSLLGVDSVLDVAINEDSQYTVDLSTEVPVFDNGSFAISVGGAYGKSFEYATDYDYVLGYAKLGIDALYVKLNYLQNDLYSDDFEATTDVGLSLNF
jgi:hypothetical protein